MRYESDFILKFISHGCFIIGFVKCKFELWSLCFKLKIFSIYLSEIYKKDYISVLM